MKNFLKLILVSVLASISMCASADYPNGQVKLLTGLPVGSGPDVMSRQLATMLQKKWDTNVIVENKPGASGAISMEAFVNEPANGLTIYVASVEHITSYPLLYNDRYTKQMESVAPFFRMDMMLVGSPKIATFDEFRTVIKDKPMFGSWGLGSIMHLAGLELGTRLSTQDPTHILYKDFGALFIDVANKEVPYAWAATATVAELERAGKVKFFAVSTATRNPNYPSVPSIKELTNLELGNPNGWVALFVHKNTPPEIKKQITNDLLEVIRTEEMRDRIRARGYIPYSPQTTNAEYQAELKKESVRVQKIIQKYNITVK